MCVCVHACAPECAYVSWCMNGSEENCGISFLSPTVQVLNAELRFLVLLAGCLSAIGPAGVSYFKNVFFRLGGGGACL